VFSVAVSVPTALPTKLLRIPAMVLSACHPVRRVVADLPLLTECSGRNTRDSEEASSRRRHDADIDEYRCAGRVDGNDFSHCG
jgi:hypothetical protein